MKHFFLKVFNYLFQKKDIYATNAEWETKLGEFQAKIKFSFKNPELLRVSLTHNSYLRKIFTEDNLISPFERMEFLGDSVLGLIVSEELFFENPEESEGTLSKLKSNIVSEKFLAYQAQKISLGEYILLSEEETKNGGKDKKSILSDCMEALICAIYIDSGLSKARQFIKSFILHNYHKEVTNTDMVNYKSLLQEHMQSLYQQVPEYLTIKEEGPDHNKTFFVDVFFNQECIGSGSGCNKKEAQQSAARQACFLYKLC